MSSIGRSESISRLDQLKVSSYFGCDTFGWRTMQERLPKEVFRSLRKCIRKGERLSAEVAHVVAQAMKDWAIERGATHFTHWFQPMTGATAEKHDAFITWDDHGGLIESFSGAQLIQGEPDASSFPSGGLRTTFEARGYTAWDPVSPAFLMAGPLGKTLCIPTAFIGYHGEALDHKVPLLRAMDFVGQQAAQALSLFGQDGAVVTAQCGAEQEYFLVDLELYKARPDLMFCNRTLQGARPPKGQELEDHYFGAIKERVLRFMQDLELELFRLGIPAKTRHNEVAPNQFELAPIYEPANVAADHNQLLMEVMKKVGERHDLAVLLGEKPFAGVNGSGKHVNVSLGSDDGQNLFDPGHSPEQNLQFLYFLSSVLLGVWRHGAVLRASVASASNDHRLGANEAPPAIMSVFLGEQLNRILDQVESGAVVSSSERKQLDLGIPALPVLAKDYTDRNRTSPMAFTGNKFEFRAVGAGQAIAVPLSVIQTIIGDALSWMNQRVREVEPKFPGDRQQAIMEVIREVVATTRAVRFDGNGYSLQWRDEAARRGLPHARSTVEALSAWEDSKVQDLFERAGVMSKPEQEARSHVRHEQYVKSLQIEAQVLREMAETQILPVILEDVKQKAACLTQLQAAGITTPDPVRAAIKVEAELLEQAYQRLLALKGTMAEADATDDLHKRTAAFARDVLPACQVLRESLDGLEDQCDARLWPLPKYRELLAPLG
ncbi:MAG TPA: glutamine synthetase III [Pseudomonadota bacterium]|nr:glutamine synthetase III [Pseudomonadota bacterium]HNI59848.1 glutamine synthetase III [Pseudomonadota bacterium]